MIAWFVLLSFATWRVSSLLYTEAPFQWLRDRLGVEEDIELGARIVPHNVIGALFDCFWCMSLVVAFVLCVPVYAFTDLNILEALAVWLASAAGALVLDVRYFARLRG